MLAPMGVSGAARLKKAAVWRRPIALARSDEIAVKHLSI